MYTPPLVNNITRTPLSSIPIRRVTRLYTRNNLSFDSMSMCVCVYTAVFVQLIILHNIHVRQRYVIILGRAIYA